MKVKFNGILKRVTAVSTSTNPTTNKVTRRQSVIVMKPAQKDEFGVPYGKDDMFELQVWNEGIEKFNLVNSLLIEKKVTVEFFMSGREVGANGNEKYFVDLKLFSITEYIPQ